MQIMLKVKEKTVQATEMQDFYDMQDVRAAYKTII